MQREVHIWVDLSEGRRVPSKSLFEQEAPKIERRSVPTKRCVRETLNEELALNDREFVKTEVFEKRAFKQMTPLN